MSKLYGVHIQTWDGDIARYLYDSFSHNEITVNDIIQKVNSGLDDRDNNEVEIISDDYHPHITNDKKFAVIFEGNEYCDIFRIVSNLE